MRDVNVIPGSIGAQEGAFVLIASAIIGELALGLAVALVRRCREIVWIIAGFALRWCYAPDNIMWPTSSDHGRNHGPAATVGDHDIRLAIKERKSVPFRTTLFECCAICLLCGQLYCRLSA